MITFYLKYDDLSNLNFDKILDRLFLTWLFLSNNNILEKLKKQMRKTKFNYVFYGLKVFFVCFGYYLHILWQEKNIVNPSVQLKLFGLFHLIVNNQACKIIVMIK